MVTPIASAAAVPLERSSARYSGSVQAFATMRAPVSGEARSVIAWRAAISSSVRMPLALSAATSFSSRATLSGRGGAAMSVPPFGNGFEPVLVDLDQHRVARVALVPQRLL